MLDVLEEEVIPLYYARNGGGYSAEWVRRCKRAMVSVIPHFNMGRVVQDYARGLYYPAASHHQRLLQSGHDAVASFAAWKQRVRERWGGVRLRRLSEPPRELPRAGVLNVRVAAALNGLKPSDVRVEFLARRVLPQSRSEPPALSSFRGDGDDAWRAPLHATGEVDSDGSHVFELQAQPPASGSLPTRFACYPVARAARASDGARLAEAIVGLRRLTLITQTGSCFDRNARYTRVRVHSGLECMAKPQSRASSGRYVSRLTSGALAVVMAGGRGERLKI